MSLGDEIRLLGHRTLAAMDESHDYYTFTKRVWRSFDEAVKAGEKFTFRNMATGSRVDERWLIANSEHYLSHYLRSAVFQQFVSLFEEYFFGLLRA